MKYDLHTHTYYSDGTVSPAELIASAGAAGLGLLALTDHDTVMGLPEGRAAAAEAGLPFLCGAEIEAEYSSKLHILALGIDPSEAGITEMLRTQEERRRERNDRMIKKLESSGMDIIPHYKQSIGCTTRTHVALALIEGGYADNMSDAFARFIGRDCEFFVDCSHPSMREVIDRIEGAGGRAVLAHPHKMRCDHASLVKSLADCGLWGVEVYYPGTSEANIRYFGGLARAHGLNITCGSDFHGVNRPEAQLGCSFREIAELEETYENIKELAI